MNTKKGSLSVQGFILVNLVRVGILACLLLAGYGLMKWVFYTGPMVEKDYYSALESPVGDEIDAMYGYALRSFKERRDTYRAKLYLSDAYNKLTHNSGLVPVGEEERASRIQHMIGVVNESEKQFRLAIAAYEESLKANPNNLESKYNLERLKNQFPDLGKQKPDQQGGNQAGNKQKGI